MNNNPRFLTLSPQIVRLAHIRKLKSTLVNVFQKLDWPIVRTNRVSGSNLDHSNTGTCSRNIDDLSLYGDGKVRFIT